MQDDLSADVVVFCYFAVSGAEEIRFENAGPHPNSNGFVDVVITEVIDPNFGERYLVKNTANNGPYIGKSNSVTGSGIFSINFKAAKGNTADKAPKLRLQFVEPGTTNAVEINKKFYLSFFDFDTNDIGTAGMSSDCFSRIHK